MYIIIHHIYIYIMYIYISGMDGFVWPMFATIGFNKELVEAIASNFDDKMLHKNTTGTN